MKSFDIFIKPANVANTSSVCGGWLTMVATVCAGLLIFMQIIDYQQE